MKNRNIILAAVVASLVAVCGLCILTLYGTLALAGENTFNIRFLDFAGQSAKVTENRTFEIHDMLIVESDSGDVKVTAADISEIEVEMTKTGWGNTEEEARKGAEDLKINVEENGDTLTIQFIKPDEITLFGGRAGTDKIDFDIRVPINIAVDLRTSFGDIDVSGSEGEVLADTSFGDVTLRNIEAGNEDVWVDTSFGMVILDSVSGRDIRVASSNGDITLEKVSAAQKLDVENRFGQITIIDMQADTVDVRDSNGRVELVGGEVAASVSVSNSFGDVVVEGVTADSFDLSSSNGDVSLDGATGSLALNSSFGDINVDNAVDAVLNLSTSNGKISFSGTLDSGLDHFIETSFGDVELNLPDDAAHEIKLETSFGDIQSDIPVTLSGSFDESEWRGEINGGGSLLDVHTSNGDITIKMLSSGE